MAEVVCKGGIRLSQPEREFDDDAHMWALHQTDNPVGAARRRRNAYA